MEKDINKVRQVMMNELGLTRESVRDLTEQIVATTVEKHIKRLSDEGWVDRLIKSEIDRALQFCSLGNDDLRNLIIKGATEAFRNELRAKMNGNKS